MKIKFTIALFFLFSYPLYSQIHIEGEPFTEVFKGKYIKVCPNCRGYNKFFALIDFGQSMARPRQHFLADKNNERLVFHTEVGIMNYMVENNFDIFFISDSTNCIIYERLE